MRKLLLPISIAFVLVSCNNKAGSGWSKGEKDVFMNTCVPKTQTQAGLTEEKSKSYCSCMLTKLEGKYANADEANKKSTSAEMTEFATSCLK